MNNPTNNPIIPNNPEQQKAKPQNQNSIIPDKGLIIGGIVSLILASLIAVFSLIFNSFYMLLPIILIPGLVSGLLIARYSQGNYVQNGLFAGLISFFIAVIAAIIAVNFSKCEGSQSGCSDVGGVMIVIVGFLSLANVLFGIIGSLIGSKIFTREHN